MRHTIKNHPVQKMFRKKCKSYMVILMSKIVEVFLNIYLVTEKMSIYSMCAFLTMPPKERCTKNKQKQQKIKAYQIAHIVPYGIKRMLQKFGRRQKWKLIMSQHGVRKIQPISKIVRCCARPTIGQKVIGNQPTAVCMPPRNSRNMRHLINDDGTPFESTELQTLHNELDALDDNG